MDGHPQAQTKRCASVRFPQVDSPAMGKAPPPVRRRRTPKLSRHSSGQARVVLGGKVHYCGVWGTPDAYARYAELLRTWQQGESAPRPKAPNAVQATLKVRDLTAQFLDHIDATGRYRKNGKPTGQRAMFVHVIDSLDRVCGDFPVTRCTEATLVAWRDRLERNPRITRRGINRKVTMVLQIFKWGRARGLVPKVVWADLAALEPLRRGEVGDRPETGRPRRAVTAEEVELVAAHCCPQVAALLRLQALCGMRPGEALAMRWADIDKTPIPGDRTGAWIYYVPGGGKTAHHGHVTRYVLPKAAQAILELFPATPLAPIFSPAAAMAERRKRRRACRKTRVQPSQQRRDADAARDYSDRWGINEYRRHVLRACEKAAVQPFTPHEVRHGFVTWAANTLSLGAAAAAANHRNVTTTQRYVHVQAADALTVAAAVQARVDARGIG